MCACEDGREKGATWAIERGREEDRKRELCGKRQPIIQQAHT